jgi:hypothetical protein
MSNPTEPGAGITDDILSVCLPFIEPIYLFQNTSFINAILQTPQHLTDYQDISGAIHGIVAKYVPNYFPLMLRSVSFTTAGASEKGQGAEGIIIPFDALCKVHFKDILVAIVTPSEVNLTLPFGIEMNQWDWKNKGCTCEDAGTSIGCYPFHLELDMWQAALQTFLFGLTCFKVLDPSLIIFAETQSLPDRARDYVTRTKWISTNLDEQFSEWR